MIHSSKIKNIINLNSRERYKYSIREFVKLEMIWAAANPNYWITLKIENGDEIFPIWPHREVAKLCLLAEMKVPDFSIVPIDYKKFKELCIPYMNRDDILFGVFYNDKGEAIAISGVDLLSDLEAEEEGGF